MYFLRMYVSTWQISLPTKLTWHWQRSHTYLGEVMWYIPRNRGIYFCHTGQSHSYNYLKYIISDPNIVTDLLPCVCSSQTVQQLIVLRMSKTNPNYLQTLTWPGGKSFPSGIGKTASFSWGTIFSTLYIGATGHPGKRQLQTALGSHCLSGHTCSFKLAKCDCDW